LLNGGNPRNATSRCSDRWPILPTRQRQLRPIVKAKLDDYAQVEVWQEAIALAQGKIPTGRIVAQAVRLYLEQNNNQINLNPFSPKEICQIVVQGNSQLKGLGGCWCIVDRVHENNVLFFANIKGRLNYQDLPASKASGYLSGRVEVDFLVFKNSTCIVLEVDGQHHQEGSQTIRDYVRDRVLLKEGIPTARFTAQECMNKTVDVITEFLELFLNTIE
jgi:hypothetical protein